MGLIPAIAGAQSDVTSFRNTAPGVHYVGSKVCAGCHAQIYSSYVKTGMGRSIISGGDASLREKLPVPATVFDQDAGEYYEVFRKDGELYQSQYAIDSEGKELFRQTFPLAYAVGAGENGFGFIVRRGNYLFEAPLTYYTKSHIWGFSPGYENSNYAFTRPILAQCISCHSGRPQPVASGVGAYRDPPLTELAIGCENCHGPGALHVSERQAGRPLNGPIDTSIVNPRHLSGYLSDNICMKCHQGEDARIEQPGKTVDDFRPGTRLGNVLAIFKVPVSRDSSSRDVLLAHYFSMTVSKCYRASAGALRCTTCHNPHIAQAGIEAASYYRTKCLNCHAEDACKIRLEERRKTNPPDDCASCHMPKRTVTTITHAALTDHWIHAKPDEPLPDGAFGSSAESRSGLLVVTAPPGDNQPDIPPVTLLQAWASLIHDGHAEFRPKMNALLDRLARESPRDPRVLSELGRRASADQTPASRAQAVRYFERALQLGSAAPDDLLMLAGLYGREHRNADAIRVLEKGAQTNPYTREFSDALAAQYIALGQYGRALDVIHQGLKTFPDDVTLRLLEKKVKAATLDGALLSKEPLP